MQANSEKDRGLAIPGINEKKSLALFGGDSEAYLSVLRSYAANTPDILEKLRSPSKENIGDYAVAVHGLKGASESIGAGPVAKKAAGLEKMAKSGNLTGILNKNPVFLKAAGKLVDDIRAYLIKSDAKNAKPRLPSPDRELLGRLRRSCEKYDMDGADAAMDMLESCGYDRDAYLITWLREKIDGADFDRAAKRLGEYEKTINIKKGEI